VSSGRWAGAHRAAVLLALVPALVALPGCASDGEGATPADAAGTAEAGPAQPGTPEELERLVVDEVASGLPRLPDEAIQPRAGAKRLEDVAGYSDDPARERSVLEDYGYRHGWERFWGAGTGQGPQTGVFVDQFEQTDGAAAYSEDLARNEAEHYGGLLSEGAPDLPPGCRRMVVDEAVPEKGLSGPAAFVWCAVGRFSVSVSAVADSLDAATEEIGAVVAEQLDRLPPA
jgi:hypothetical protein